MNSSKSTMSLRAIAIYLMNLGGVPAIKAIKTLLYSHDIQIKLETTLVLLVDICLATYFARCS